MLLKIQVFENCNLRLLHHMSVCYIITVNHLLIILKLYYWVMVVLLVRLLLFFDIENMLNK